MHRSKMDLEGRNLEGAAFAERQIPEGNDFLSREELDALTPEEMVRRAKELRPLLAKNTRQAEIERKPVDEVWSALRKAGFFYHFVPKKFGGLEFEVEPFIDIVYELAQGCTSTAWVMSFCMEHNWMMSQFPEQAQEEIFGHSPYIIAPGVNSPTMVATPVDGGFNLSGLWRFGTCIMHSDWILGGGTIPGEDPPQPWFFVLPAEEAIVHDTWHVDGMIGTGSNDIELRNVFVPSHRVTHFGKMSEGTAYGREVHSNPLYRQPMLPFLTVTAGSCIAGAARAAIDAFADYLSKRTLFGTGERQVDKPSAHMRLGKADMMVRSAHRIIRDVALRNREAANRPGIVPAEERFSLRADVAYAVHSCREAVNLICCAAGSSAHHLDNPLQRAQRDINTGANHVVFELDATTEQLGRIMLGLPMTTPLA